MISLALLLRIEWTNVFTPIGYIAPPENRVKGSLLRSESVCLYRVWASKCLTSNAIILFSLLNYVAFPFLILNTNLTYTIKAIRMRSAFCTSKAHLKYSDCLTCHHSAGQVARWSREGPIGGGLTTV